MLLLDLNALDTRYDVITRDVNTWPGWCHKEEDAGHRDSTAALVRDGHSIHSSPLLDMTDPWPATDSHCQQDPDPGCSMDTV